MKWGFFQIQIAKVANHLDFRGFWTKNSQEKQEKKLVNARSKIKAISVKNEISRILQKLDKIK